MTSASNFFDVVLFLLSTLVTGSSFMSLSLVVLDLWGFSFISDWPEIRKSEILPSEFWPIFTDLGGLDVPDLVMKCYWMLQNARVTVFTISVSLSENQQRGGVKLPPPPTPRLRLTTFLGPLFKSIFPDN